MHRNVALPIILGAALSFGACASDRAVGPESEPPTANAQRVGQITTGNLIAALNNVAVVIQEIEALNNLTIADVRIVNVEDVLNNARILNNSRFLNNIAILQNFLNESLNDVNVQILNDALNQNNVVISDVVAIDVLSGGDVIVFTR